MFFFIVASSGASGEEQLIRNGVSFRKTKRAEKIRDFDQAPDFIIPDEFAPQVVIEAKLTEDDGTALCANVDETPDPPVIKEGRESEI